MPMLDMNLVAKIWLEAFKFRPLTTVVGTLCGVVLAAGAAYYISSQDQRARDSSSVASVTYQKQVENLQQTETNVRELLAFVENEKKKLQDSEKVLGEMKAEHDRLSPIVETDRKTVDAVLNVQAAQQARGVWRERGIGCVFGVGGSLIASFIFAVMGIVYRKARNRNKSSAAVEVVGAARV
ncbi:MAG: hypothetical protein JWP03_735 [Phycisphaerales bacterium]|jgi:hypothetical protein|nr:hypothetical protein [Phycisphaerales bacterium]